MGASRPERKQLGMGVDFFSLLNGVKRTRGRGLHGEIGSDVVETFF